MTEQPPKELVKWLDEIREKGIMPSRGNNTSKTYFIHGYRKNGEEKDFRMTDAYDAEHMAEMLWNTGNWTRLDINGVTRYGE